MKLFNLMLFTLIFIGCASSSPFVKPSQNSARVYLKAHPELDSDVKQAISNGNIILGMSKNDVLAVWGKPDTIFLKDKPRFKYEPPPWNEQWVWKGAFFRTFSQDCTITFSDDKVENIQCESIL
ncbi:MAG: hypothetical protein H6754_02055 [Candidatus Omnitrophica bacterium]|nr:hypothetical protein [Candidatus Omnitrophota bacterium]